jgi:hypothetical protein
VDTSQARIVSGDLTLAKLEAVATQANVRAVLFATGRFDLVPGFRTWVAAHFVHEASFGPGADLYVRLPHAPQAA